MVKDYTVGLWFTGTANVIAYVLTFAIFRHHYDCQMSVRS